MDRRNHEDGWRTSALVLRSSAPAFRAGVNVDDELVAIDGVRVRAELLDAIT
jgi:hypothetical protein